MINLDLLQILKSYMEEQLINNKADEEWVYIDLINFNTIDITVVSGKDFKDLKPKEIVNNIIEDIYNDDDKKPHLRFFDFFSIEEANFMGKDKPVQSITIPISFGNAFSLKQDKSNEKNIDKKPRVISFYSYKGGVGRTITMIQTAYFLAKKGKKVLMIDLDIEAPSFQDIFEKFINKKTKGLVDYLYSKLYSIKSEVTPNSIVSKISLNIKGDIFLIPSTSNLDFEYLRKLELLKEDKIINDKYIINLIEEIKKQYNIDYVFIDSRTGLNKWGAISLLEVANESILLAYPNKENVKGLQLIMNLLDKSKKFTVIFSRIDTNEEGLKISNKLFKALKLDQEPIYIGYDPLIANSQSYPMEETLSMYENIGNFLLEEDINDSVNSYINKHPSQIGAILNNINNIDIHNLKTNNDEKIIDDNNYFIIQSSGFEEGLRDYFKSNEYLDRIIIENDYGDLDKTINKDCLDTMLNFKMHLYAYIIKSINDFDECKSLRKTLNNYDILKNKSIEEYKEYLSEQSLGEVEPYVGVDEFFLDLYNYDFGFDSENLFNEIVFIMDFSSLYESSWLNEDILKILLEVVLYMNTHTSLKLKLILNSDFYSDNKAEFNYYGSNILELDWCLLSRANVIKEIEQVLVDTTRQDGKELIQEMMKSVLGDINKLHMHDEVLDGDISLILYSVYKDAANMIYGKRIHPYKYSKLISYWIYDKLKENDILSKKDLATLIKYAIDIEKDSNNLNRMSVISFDSFDRAITKLTGGVQS